MLQLIRLPSDAPEADERPFILLVPGGGFVNVWNLTEGWPPPMETRKRIRRRTNWPGIQNSLRI